MVPGTHQVHCVRADELMGVILLKCQTRLTLLSAEDARFVSLTLRYIQMLKAWTQMKMSKIRPQMLSMWTLDSRLWLHMMGNDIPGRLLLFSNIQGMKVSVLHRSGSCCKWPQPKDMIKKGHCAPY